MRLYSVTVAEGRQEWLWYALRAAVPGVEALVVAHLGPADPAWAHAAGDRLRLLGCAPGSGHGAALAAALGEARRGGATHVLLLGPAEIYARRELIWCRRLLEETTLQGARLELPPRQHERRHDPEPTDGVLVRHLALRRLRPGPGALTSGRVEPETEVRWCCLDGLVVDPAGRLLEPTGEAVEDSPWRLKLGTTPFWDLACPPAEPGEPFPAWALPPRVLRDPSGPGHPLLKGWGCSA